MPLWTGWVPTYPHRSFNLRQWADDRSDGWLNADGSLVEWWYLDDNGGILVTPPPCAGVTCEDASLGCDNTVTDPCADPDDSCVIAIPDAIRFVPFWVKAQFKCDAVGRDPDLLYRMADAHLDTAGWTQIARHYHKVLAELATDLSTDQPTCASEAIGSLLRARGVQGLHPGVLTVPGYLVPTLQAQGLLTYDAGGRPLGPGGIPIIADSGLPTTGPNGATPPASSGYIYITDSVPSVAFHDVRHPHDGPFDFQNDNHRRLFWDDDKNGSCFEPKIRRQAIAAVNPCGAYAVAVQACEA